MSPTTRVVAPLADSASAWPDVVCPPDKSVTHRAILFAAMAQGESRIENPLLGADCLSTAGVFRALGVVIDEEREGQGKRLLVRSPGWDGWRSPAGEVDYGNSGTTARLLTGVFAATPGLRVRAFGDASLSKRPMARVVSPLRSIGARIEGQDGGNRLPLQVEGTRLRPARHVVVKASAQVKSALLLAGLNIEGETIVELPTGSRDHTEVMLEALGATLRVERSAGLERITLRGPFRPRPQTYRMPGDPSSAAFWAVLAACADRELRVRGVMTNATRTGFVTVLERMGARLSFERVGGKEEGELEPMADLVMRSGGKLRGIVISSEEAGPLVPTLIDEVPVLAVAFARAQGETRVAGLGELRVKESDRLAKTVELLRAAGAEAEAEGDSLRVSGGLTRARAFRFDPEGDHRLAMAAAILARFAEGPCEILGPECVDVSYPGFFDVLESLR